jgi:hypothetical protein
MVALAYGSETFVPLADRRARYQSRRGYGMGESIAGMAVS